MSELSTIVQIASWLGKSIASSGGIFEDFSTEFLGVDLPSSVTEVSGVQNALGICKNAAEDLSAAVTDLENLPADASAGEITVKFVMFADGLRAYFVSIPTLINALESAIASSSLSGAAATAAGDLKDRFRKVFADYIIVTSIEYITPQLLLILKILGLVDWQRTNLPEGFVDDGVSKSYVKKELQLHKFKNLISDPGNHFIDTIGWGHPDFDPSSFFRIFTEFLRDEEVFSLDEIDGDPILSYGIFSIRRQSSEAPPALELVLTGDFEKTETLSRNLGDILRFNLEAGFGYEGGASALIKPPLEVNITPNLGEISGRLKVYIDRQESARPFNIINAGSFRLSVDDTPFGIGLEADWDIDSGSASINPLIFADISKGNIEIDTSDGDSFVASLLSGAEIKGNFDLGFEWSGKDGLRIKASGGIEIMLPLHINLGILEIKNLYIVLNIKDTGTLSLEISAGFTGKLGPLAATVERLGTLTNLKFSENSEADLGLFDLDLDFKPPNGVGLSIDAGVVKGGGFLRFYPEKEEYDGILELDLSGIVSVKAIGLITTKMPDGSKGFSLLLILTAEFGSPIQLGFGFTLSGVGGLLGLNRTMRLEVIATGIRDGGINSVMFPQNVIENAPRIISDLKKYFPVEEGTFLIGPMVKIGWGTPNLVTVSLGVIIEIPGNIAILGVLKLALPDENAALVVIQVNFIGAIEFDKKRLWFFASIFESRVLFITLEGEMGLLVGWGNDANFVVSVGGFHPAFNPPALPFGAIARIAINILNTDFARIRIEGYFAVTSNTVQFGAKVELFFGVDAFNIDGHLAFDALFRFSPFYFIITISASLSVKVFGIGLFSVRMRGELEGPTPWHVEGTGSISLLFFDIDVDFSHTWGNEEDTTLPPITVMPLLTAEFEKMENWQAVVPDSNQLLVSLREIEQSTTDLILHPVGSLKVSQRFVPLGIEIDKVGNQKPDDANEFSVDLEPGSGLSKIANVTEQFATGQFISKSDDALLSSKSYEPINSGIEMAVEGEQYRSPQAVRRVVRYEKIIIDSFHKRFIKPFFTAIGSLFTLFLKGNAISRSALSYKKQKQLQPFAEKVAVGNTLYGVASNSDNTAFSESSINFTSQVQAEDYLRKQVKNDANLADQLHVIPQVEMQEAA